MFLLCDLVIKKIYTYKIETRLIYIFVRTRTQSQALFTVYPSQHCFLPQASAMAEVYC